MTIPEQLEVIKNGVIAAWAAIEAQGVVVPSTATITDMWHYIGMIKRAGDGNWRFQINDTFVLCDVPTGQSAITNIASIPLLHPLDVTDILLVCDVPVLPAMPEDEINLSNLQSVEPSDSLLVIDVEV